jgi:hypothetical protein
MQYTEWISDNHLLNTVTELQAKIHITCKKLLTCTRRVMFVATRARVVCSCFSFNFWIFARSQISFFQDYGQNYNLMTDHTYHFQKRQKDFLVSTWIRNVEAWNKKSSHSLRHHRLLDLPRASVTKRRSKPRLDKPLHGSSFYSPRFCCKKLHQTTSKIYSHPPQHISCMKQENKLGGKLWITPWGFKESPSSTTMESDMCFKHPRIANMCQENFVRRPTTEFVCIP